ncbi:flagellar motor protein MotD [Cellulomonas hominis]|uniref:Chemotaxis protein MotB n=1 Tax=Cellulomonas hominis TaxID=156981 RepID=A0A511FG55_9CELL|nr:flagellar motor protein MotB [Cellulomonas hominis]MBB5472195.1 chemotaxis protein MotB [Cellulomonas hominis]NKY07031.1 flagellar motor protein MotB [Cellulomonas hominis]GEL47307.1 flagellar motor protein MotD [Cellulomonas hominis]
MSSHGGRGRGRRGGGHEEEHVNHERWLVSYSDMITVLMALFIVLFAISQVDQEKYVALKASLAAGFGDGSVNQSVLDGSDGALDGLTPGDETQPDSGTAGIVDADEGLGLQATDPAPQTEADPTQVDPATLAAAQAEAAHLEEVREQILNALRTAALQDSIRFRMDERGLVLGLVADDVFFAQGSAQLTPTAMQVLDLAAPTLVGLQEQISVEGHANTVPISGRYATNWELSSDRATQVLRHMVENDGMPGTRIQAVGYGDTRPLVQGTDDTAMTANRRVDMVILSVAPEAVRALLPAVAAGSATGG